MVSVKTVIYCIKCPDTFQTEEEAKAHFHKAAHGWTSIWEHGFEGRVQGEARRKKDGRRHTRQRGK